MNDQEIKTILEKHKRWINNKEGGECANLWDADLSDANLRGADLRGANLRGANLRGADLQGADLWRANLQGANLQGADLWRANLQGADLQGADLSDANLWDANLRGAVGNSKQIKSLFISEIYPIVYTSEYLQIGCERHQLDDWWGFDDKRIEQMDGQTALDFWAQWKPVLKALIEQNPATKTGGKEPND